MLCYLILILTLHVSGGVMRRLTSPACTLNLWVWDPEERSHSMTEKSMPPDTSKLCS